MWVVIHFDHADPDGDKPNPWVVDYINPSGLGAADAINELEEADSSIKYYIGRVA